MASARFKTLDEMTNSQADRELQEALRVRSMSPYDRFQWLQQAWGRLQDDGTKLFPDRLCWDATARCYASFDEKNLFEETREMELALQHQRAFLS